MKITVQSPDAPLLEELTEHSLMNYYRIENLIQLYEKETKDKKGKRFNHQIDILRSAVVFIHATLEDGMRSIAKHYLPLCDKEIIDKIPLIDINKSGKPEKFFLGRLLSHSDKSVNELIEESISSYLDKISFSSVSDIASMLSTFKINQSKINKLYPSIEEMMKRRHHIVHRADKIKASGPGRQYAKSLSAKKVRDWNDKVNIFFALVVEEYVRPIFWQENEKGQH